MMWVGSESSRMPRRFQLGGRPMAPRTRREFLSHVSQGMMVAAAGSDAAVSLELAPAFAAGNDGSDRLKFGRLEPLVQLMQETEANRLLAELTQRLKSGT